HRESTDPTQSPNLNSRSSILESAGLFAPRPRPSAKKLGSSNTLGRWREGKALERGPGSGPIRVYRPGSVVSWSATLRAAAPCQTDRREPDSGLVLQAEHFRGWPRRGPVGCLLLFVVDSSGSMAAWQQMRQTKAAVLSLLLRAYQQRDQVAILAFHGKGT